VLPATASGHRIRAVATISAVDIARQFRLGADGTQDPAVFQSMLDAAPNARTVAAKGEKPPVLTLFPDTIEQARALGGEHGADGFDYRTPRAQHPRSATFLDWTSIDKTATFDAFAPIPLIGKRPLPMIAGSRAVTSWMTVEAFQNAFPRRRRFISDALQVSRAVRRWRSQRLAGAPPHEVTALRTCRVGAEVVTKDMEATESDATA
jgi:hypothetical protein